MKNICYLALLVALVPTIPSLAAPYQKTTSVLALAGYETLTGEGVVITLHDRNMAVPKDPPRGMPGLVHDYDVVSLVNELRSAGAQGITVGGVRLTNQSSITSYGPQLRVDKTPVSVPLRIEAVGNAELLKASLKVKGGVLDQLQSEGPRYVLSTASKLRLKAAPLPRNTSVPKLESR